MKKWMIFGSLVGFAVGVVTGIWQGNSPAIILWRSCVTALTGGLLMRWWAKILFGNLKSAILERAAALEAEQSATPAATQKS